MPDSASTARETPRSLGAVDPPLSELLERHSERRRHVVSNGGLYLTWRQTLTVLGVVTSALAVAKGVWPVVQTAATIPATVERINASTTQLAALVETLQREQAGVQRDQENLQRDQADVRRSVEQLGVRITALEPTVAALDALRIERGRQMDELTGRVAGVERSLRSTPIAPRGLQ